MSKVPPAYADEAPLLVLKEKGRSPTQKSYMWLLIGVSTAMRTCRDGSRL